MNAKSVRYVGLDVHKRVVEACLVDQAGKVVHRERFALNRHTLELFAKRVLRPSDHVALEATTNCWAVADALRPHVARVVVSNPLATKAIAQAKVKTDKVDAHVLAQLLRCDFLPEVWPPDEATRQLRELTGRRSALVGQRTRMRNRIHSVLAMRLIEAPLRLFHASGLEWLAAVELDAQARLLVDSDLRQLELLQKEIDVLDVALAQRGYASDPVKLLMTLPGVDVATAEAIFAAWGDAKRFPDGDHAASYLGLVPSTHQSANQCYHGPITKRGNSHARWMLIEAAQHLDKHPGPLGHFFRRLARKKNRNVAVVAGARKLAMIAWMMLKSNEPYRYALPRSTETKLARLRVKASGQRRQGGSPQGVKCTAKLPGGGRTIKSLAGVCASEGLPTPLPLSPGEQRTVRESACAEWVAQIAAPQVVPRRSRQTPTPTLHDESTPHAQSAPPNAPHADTAEPQAARSPAASSPDFRRPPADEQGSSLPPPAPPASLFSAVPPGTATSTTATPAPRRPKKPSRPKTSLPAS
jgi:transposase